MPTARKAISGTCKPSPAARADRKPVRRGPALCMVTCRLFPIANRAGAWYLPCRRPKHILLVRQGALTEALMILDILDNAGRYSCSGEFAKAFAFLKRPDLADLPPGRHEIDGDRVFALLSRGPGRKRHGARLEVHERYIDIQYVIAGSDEMGWKPMAGCGAPAGPYDPEKDIRFFFDGPDAWFEVRAGAFAVFFPEDAHLPLVSDGVVHKAVVKVAVSGEGG